ncbi:MAG: type II toxin-antitoxin system VapC family toxin [Nanoarchaeota archaeon]
MFLDTNIFLEIILEQNNAERCKLFLREVLEGRRDVFLSTFSIDSTVLNLVRHNLPKDKISLFLNTLVKYKGLKFYQVKIKDRVSALTLSDKYNLDYEDSLILQCAFSTKSEEIVSFDKHFDKIKEIKRIEP